MAKAKRKNSILCESLQEILDFIQKTHKTMYARKGVYCLKLLRKSSGVRIPFEEMSGVHLRSFQIHDHDTVIVQQHSHGTPFKGGMLQAFDSTLWLTDIAMINVYDYSAEFWSMNNIDFVYLQQTKEAKTVMMAEWMHDIPKNLRAQWFRDEESEKLLKDIGMGRKIRRKMETDYYLDI